MAGGADVILIPELPLTVERCCEVIQPRHRRGKDFSIVVVSEGFGAAVRERRHGRWRAFETDAFGQARGRNRRHAGREIEAATGFETRVTTLGHVQRGGTPTAARPDAGDPLRPQGRGDGTRP